MPYITLLPLLWCYSRLPFCAMWQPAAKFQASYLGYFNHLADIFVTDLVVIYIFNITTSQLNNFLKCKFGPFCLKLFQSSHVTEYGTNCLARCHWSLPHQSRNLHLYTLLQNVYSCHTNLLASLAFQSLFFFKLSFLFRYSGRNKHTLPLKPISISQALLQ